MAVNMRTHTVPPPCEDPRITMILASTLAQIHNDLLGKCNHMRRMILRVIEEKKDYQLGMESLKNTLKELKDDLDGREEFLRMWRDPDHDTADQVSLWGEIIKLYYSLVYLAHGTLNESLVVLECGNNADIQILANAWSSSETTRPTLKVIIKEFERSLRASRLDARACEPIVSRFNNLGNTKRATQIKIERIDWVKKKLDQLRESRETRSRSSGGRPQSPAPSSRRRPH